MKQWQRAEQFWQQKFAGGKRQPGSGNQPGAPGDVRYLDRVQFAIDHKVLLEAKHTDFLSLSIQYNWLTKVTREAALLGRVPLLGISIRDEHWLAIPAWVIDPDEIQGRTRADVLQPHKKWVIEPKKS